MKKIICLLLTITSLSLVAQQDPLYSQYQFNQLMINPAYAGMYSRFSAGMINRFQWVGVEGAPQTNIITGQAGLKDGKIGIGGMVLNDRFGVSDNYELQVAGSYNINFPESRLGMGIQGGMIQYGYDFSNVSFDFIDDPEILNGHETILAPNFGVGFMYMSEYFFIGGSIPRILNVTVTDGVTTSERYRRHYYFSSGFVKEFNRVPFKVIALIRSMDGGTISADLSASIFFDKVLWAGLTVRDLRHFGAFVILSLGETLQIGYSGEVPASSLIYGNYGTHEISLQFTFRTSRRSLFTERFF